MAELGCSVPSYIMFLRLLWNNMAGSCSSVLELPSYTMFLPFQEHPGWIMFFLLRLSFHFPFFSSGDFNKFKEDSQNPTVFNVKILFSSACYCVNTKFLVVYLGYSKSENSPLMFEHFIKQKLYIWIYLFLRVLLLNKQHPILQVTASGRVMISFYNIFRRVEYKRSAVDVDSFAGEDEEENS